MQARASVHQVTDCSPGVHASETMSEENDASVEKVDHLEKGKTAAVEKSKERYRNEDFRLKQLDIGSIENAKFRRKWWQLWCVAFQMRLAVAVALLMQ